MNENDILRLKIRNDAQFDLLFNQIKIIECEKKTQSLFPYTSYVIARNKRNG